MPPGAALAFLVLALLNNVVPFVLFAWAQEAIDGGLASILNATTPIWGVLVAHLFTADEKATPAKVAGVLLGFAGVAVMIGADLLGRIGTGVLAQLACLAATLCYALAGVYARRFRAMGVPPVAVATGQLTASAIVMLPLVLIFEPPWRCRRPSPAAWLALVALALLLHQPRLHPLFPPARLGRRDQLAARHLPDPGTAILLGALILARAARAAPLRRHGADRRRPRRDRRAAVRSARRTAAPRRLQQRAARSLCQSGHAGHPPDLLALGVVEDGGRQRVEAERGHQPICGSR